MFKVDFRRDLYRISDEHMCIDHRPGPGFFNVRNELFSSVLLKLETMIREERTLRQNQGFLAALASSSSSNTVLLSEGVVEMRWPMHYVACGNNLFSPVLLPGGHPAMKPAWYRGSGSSSSEDSSPADRDRLPKKTKKRNLRSRRRLRRRVVTRTT